MIRIAALLLIAAPLMPAGWTESVEFPWSVFPRPLWERELVWIKNIGIAHVSLPPAASNLKDGRNLDELIHILRRLNLEADLEGPVPETLQPQTRAHGGPLTEPPASPPTRLSLTSAGAFLRSRGILMSANPAIVWTDVEDTLGPDGFHAGAVTFEGRETAATTALRRDAQLSHYWGETLGTLHKIPGAAARLPAPGITIQQFESDNGVSLVSVVNATGKAWTGDLKAIYPVLKRFVALPSVTVPANDSLWLPVYVPLTIGPLCTNCTGFASVDHLIYSTAELTGMEYENGVLALEFAAPTGGEAVLQVSRQPSGPYVAGGKPSSFDWDDADKHLRLRIPAGTGPTAHVRIGLAIDAPDQTAFFDNARVLTIGETNSLTAEFSSEGIMQRSRLRTMPELHTSQQPGKEPLKMIYKIDTPAAAIHGDHADLALEADGSQMSHARPQLLRPVTLRFTDAIGVRVGANSTLTLSPAAVPVNRKTGRDVTVSIRNNAPEIRNFTIRMTGDGLDFSPAKIDVAVGASAEREVSFRVFATEAAAGIHMAEASIAGAASATEPVRFIVVPQSGAVAFESDGVVVLESATRRADFIAGRWLEFVDKGNGKNALPPGGTAFEAGAVEPKNDSIAVGGNMLKMFRMQDLEAMTPAARKPTR